MEQQLRWLQFYGTWATLPHFLTVTTAVVAVRQHYPLCDSPPCVVQGQVGCGSEQPGLVERVHGRGVGTG